LIEINIKNGLDPLRSNVWDMVPGLLAS